MPFTQNTTGTFITAKLWLLHLQKRMEDVAAKIKGGADSSNRPKQPRNISLIIIGSEAGVWGVPGNPDYAASKSAVQYGLMLSVAPDAARIHPRARVNAVCPGTVDTMRFQQECAEDPRDSLLWVESEATVASRKAVQSEEIARLCLYLASERWSASTTGQTWRIDGGKSGRLFWNRDGSPTWT